MIKKIFLISATVILILTMLFGCSVPEQNPSEKINIVCTIFPQYDWVRELLKDIPDQYKFSFLTDNGCDIHNYQPSADDIIKISSADIVIYTGGESDSWVRDALKNTDSDTIALNMLEIIGSGVKNEEISEGMTKNKTEHSDAPELDEHVWLSLKKTKLIIQAISNVLCEKYPENKEKFIENANNYSDKLSALDTEYENAVKNSSIDTLIFTDRFPFRYLTDDYGIKYFAAFPGCSAESEASFETVAFLSKQLNALNLPSVIVIDSGNKELAGTVIENTKEKNQEILSLNSMQSVTKNDIDNGITYLAIMEENLNTLKKALGN